MMKRTLCLLFALGITCFANACASTTSDALRVRDLTPEVPKDSRENAILFVPKGAYITNIQNASAFQVGSWVRGVPGNDLWPKDDTPPIVLTAKVVERRSKLARLELLTYADGIRPSYDVTAISYTPDAAKAPGAHTSTSAEAQSGTPLHAITKRLVLPERTDKHNAVVAQPGLNDIRGNELYAALDLDAPPTRLAASIAAILSVTETNAEFATLTTLKGEIPEHPIFVLLDAFTEPGYSVNILLNGINNAKKIEKQINELLQGLPSQKSIKFKNAAKSSNAAAIKSTLGQKRTMDLDVILHQADADRLTVSDQSLRLGIHPNPVILAPQADVDTAALATTTRALLMAGDPVSAAYLLEQAIRDDESFALVSTALGDLYHDIERDDWALELALEAGARAEATESKQTRAQLYIAQAAIAATIARTDEFKTAFKQAKSNAKKVSPPWKQALFRAFAIATLSDRSYSGDTTSLFKDLQSDLTPFDRQLYCFALRAIDSSACEVDTAPATPFETIYYDAMQKFSNASFQDEIINDTLDALDDVGAPYFAQLFWLKLARRARNAEAAEALMLNAMGYAHRTQNHRAEISIAADIRKSRAARGASMRDKGLQTAFKRWQSLDSRAQLAALCYETATQDARSIDERNKLLKYAYELYLSIGDATNAMTCQNALRENNN